MGARNMVNENRFRELYAAGATKAEIAEAFGITTGSINRICERFDLPKLKSGRRPPPSNTKLDKIDVAEFQRMFSEGVDALEMAEVFEVNRTTIYHWAHQLGVKRAAERQSLGVERDEELRKRDEQFRKLHATGASRLELAQAFNLHPDSVRYVCRRLGIPRPLPAHAAVFPNLDKEKFSEMVRSGAHTREIAEQYRIHPTTVLKWARRLNLPLPATPAANDSGGQRRVYDRDLFRELDAAGLSGSQIAERLGCSKRQVERIRDALGLKRGRPHFKYPQSVRDEALRLLDDGASYHEVARTLDVRDTTIRKWFPGRGWTHSQAVEYRHMLSKLEDVSAVNGHGEGRSGWRKTGAY